MFALLLLGGTVWLFFAMPTGFIPSQDSGFFIALSLAGQDISFDSMAKHQHAVMTTLMRDPNSAAVGAFIPAGNSGVAFMSMKPRPERRLAVDQMINGVRPKLAQIPGLMVLLQNTLPITIIRY